MNRHFIGRRSQLLGLILVLAPSPLLANTFVVTNPADAGPRTLRAAIRAANLNAGSDRIEFQIAKPGVQVITLTSPLPDVGDPVVIDGYTQPGARPATTVAPAALKIVLDGGMVADHALSLAGDGNAVLGLVIQNFVTSGVLIGGANNRIAGNYIGTSADGTTAAGNGQSAVEVTGDRNVIGGIIPEYRNLISGNLLDGVLLSGSAVSNDVLGNYIGVDVTGLTALANLRDGVRIYGDRNVIGGASIEARNIISGNLSDGVELGTDTSTTESNTAESNTIIGNYIGLDVTGQGALANAACGVHIADAASNDIGGASAGEGNVISANGADGVLIEATSNAALNQVISNIIGLDAFAVADRGNGSSGVRIRGGVGNTVDSNVISGNAVDGVTVSEGAAQNAIVSNSIFDNDALGIDLDANGVTWNDGPLDPDVGSNSRQNFPVLALVTIGANLTIQWSLSSRASTDFRIQFFSNSACDPSNHGEGATLIGSTDTITNTAGTDGGTFTTTVGGVLVGSAITATASRLNGGTPVETSEFSACVKAM